MVQQFKILLFLSLLLLSYQQLQVQQEQEQCIYGQNCPYGQGTCIDNFFCKCNEGYYSFKDKTLPPGQPQTYCNYEQISHHQTAFLELFLLGHFSVGHYWLGTIKVLLFVTFLSITYYREGKFKLPDLYYKLKKIFGCLVESALSRGGSDKSLSDIILDFIGLLTGDIWALMYFADYFLYQFNLYKDGNGVPLA
jgi:hypothetical protein